MSQTEIARRRGPLTALVGAAPALGLGDVAARHVRFTATGAETRVGAAERGLIPWQEVRTVVFDPPTTWWPHPAIGDAVVPLVGGLLGETTSPLLGADGTAQETPTFAVRIATHGGDREWQATLHHLSGYRRKDVAVARSLVEYLVTHPEARVLLAHPAELLDRVDSLVKGPPRFA